MKTLASKVLSYTVNGREYTVQAITDGAGSQVVVHTPRAHLISPSLENHKEAMKLRKSIIDNKRVRFPKFTNLNKNPLHALFLMFVNQRNG